MKLWRCLFEPWQREARPRAATRGRHDALRWESVGGTPLRLLLDSALDRDRHPLAKVAGAHVGEPIPGGRGAQRTVGIRDGVTEPASFWNGRRLSCAGTPYT